MKKRWRLEEAMMERVGKDGLAFLRRCRTAMIAVDNLVDKGNAPGEYFLRIRRHVESAWRGERPKVENEWEEQFSDAMRLLRRIWQRGFRQTEQVYNDILAGYAAEYRWASMRYRWLPAETIRQLNTRIGAEVTTIFVHCQLPAMTAHGFAAVAGTTKRVVAHYGLAVKMADNLMSLKADFTEGFITVPKEWSDAVSGCLTRGNVITGIDRDKLRFGKGLTRELRLSADDAFRRAEKLLDAKAPSLGLHRKQIDLLQEWAGTWREE